jgi:hypothetical protein
VSTVVESIRDEFLRFKALAEAAIGQLTDEELGRTGSSIDNSIATICWHVSGNLRSRFTDFLTTDGEKPWRHRDEEFVRRTVARAELLEKWGQGWTVLLSTLNQLTDEQLALPITIRGQEMRAHEALHRSLGHIAYHVGQIVFIAKSIRGSSWRTLSIPLGGSEEYNHRPRNERPAAHRAALLASGKDAGKDPAP